MTILFENFFVSFSDQRNNMIQLVTPRSKNNFRAITRFTNKILRLGVRLISY